MKWCAVFAIAFLLCGCAPAEREHLVLYTSQDQFYAEEIIDEFRKSTGIDVRPVFDTESAKTAGLANRLRAEARNPLCDVFWNNEEMHTRFLVQDGVIASNEWFAAGYRTRRMVINTNFLPLAEAPRSLLELTNARWKGKIALAYPLFGTTAYHFVALRQFWGDERWKSWCESLAQNEAKIVDGNSVVVKLVGAGEAWIGLTDSDDIEAGKRQGWSVLELPLGPDTLAIPNTVGLIKSPNRHPAAGRLAEYLTSAATLDRLVALGALEGSNYQEIAGRTITIDWERAHAELPEIREFLANLFVRS